MAVAIVAVVAVDGEMQTPSETLSIYTYSQMPATGDMSGAIPDSTIAHAGWFIGMLFAVIVLICVMVAVCFIKMNRGGKYAVQEKEERHGRTEQFDEGGFSEFTRP